MTAVGHRVTALGRASGSGSGERDEQETGIEGEGGVDAERAFAAFHARWTIDNALGKDASSLPRQEPRRADRTPTVIRPSPYSRNPGWMSVAIRIDGSGRRLWLRRNCRRARCGWGAGPPYIRNSC